MDAPDGFAPYGPQGPFVEHVGPVLEAGEEQGSFAEVLPSRTPTPEQALDEAEGIPTEIVSPAPAAK